MKIDEITLPSVTSKGPGRRVYRLGMISRMELLAMHGRHPENDELSSKICAAVYIAVEKGIGSISLDLSGIDVTVVSPQWPGVVRACRTRGYVLSTVKSKMPRRTDADEVSLAYEIAVIKPRCGWGSGLDINIDELKNVDRMKITQSVFDSGNIALLFAMITGQKSALVSHPFLSFKVISDDVIRLVEGAGIRAVKETKTSIFLDWTNPIRNK